MSYGIEIGTKWIDRRGRENTVVDIWTTRNLAGDEVRVEYVSEHEFCSQIVTSRDVAVTVAMGMARYQEGAK